MNYFEIKLFVSFLFQVLYLIYFTKIIETSVFKIESIFLNLLKVLHTFKAMS